MKPKLLLLFLLVCSSLLFSQEYIFGKVSTDLGDKLPDAVVINMRTDEKIVSDRDGNFMIAAKNGDEIRVKIVPLERQQRNPSGMSWVEVGKKIELETGENRQFNFDGRSFYLGLNQLYRVAI